ncbi:unnamed protein product, partial [Prorocentrum cordatum]
GRLQRVLRQRPRAGVRRRDGGQGALLAAAGAGGQPLPHPGRHHLPAEVGRHEAGPDLEEEGGHPVDQPRPGHDQGAEPRRVWPAPGPGGAERRGSVGARKIWVLRHGCPGPGEAS